MKLIDLLKKYFNNLKPIARMGPYCRQVYLEKTLGNISFKKVLDAGCGNGFYSKYLSGKHSDVTVFACDRTLKHLRKESGNTQRIHYFCSSLETLSLKSKFDLIICMDVLEHIEDDYKVVRTFHDHLSDHGHVYIHVPFHPQVRHFKRFKQWSLADHVRSGYAESEIESLLSGNGLRVVYLKRTFGWFGSLAWEIGKMVESLPFLVRTLLKATLNQLLKPFIYIDYLLVNPSGNGIALLAVKDQALKVKASTNGSVLLITNEYPPQVGGVANYSAGLKHLLNGMTGKVIILTSSPDSGSLSKKEFLTRRVPPGAVSIYLSFLVKGFLLVKHHRVSKIMAMSWSPGGWIAFIIKLFTGIPYSVISFGGDVLKGSGGPGSIVADFPRKILRKSVFYHAANNVAISNYTRKLITRYYPHPDKIKVLYPYIDTQLFKLDKPELSSHENRKFCHKRILLTIARLVRNKGVDQVINVLPELLSIFPDIHYVVIGDGPDRSRLELLRNRLGLISNCTFTSYVDTSDLHAWINLSELVLLLSHTDYKERCTEGFGMILLEAAACAKPVIAANSGGIPEAVMDGKTGILVDPGSREQLYKAMEKILSDKKLAESYGKAGYNRCIKEFSPVIAGEKLNKILNQI